MAGDRPLTLNTEKVLMGWAEISGVFETGVALGRVETGKGLDSNSTFRDGTEGFEILPLQFSCP